MKKLIQYTIEMNRIDPAGIPSGIAIAIMFYVVYFILIPLFS